MGTTALKAIDTHYAGHRFRSRLEARWAVFFDTMGWRWEYEAQGYELPHRISGREGVIRYLPDFWLPDLNAHAEVKGQLDRDDDLLRLLDVAAAISAPHGGCGEGPDMIVFGQVPSEHSNFHPTVLHMHKGGLFATPLTDSNRCDGMEVASDVGGSLAHVCEHYSPRLVRRILLGGMAGVGRPALDRSYSAARKARFEHGEHGR